MLDYFNYHGHMCISFDILGLSVFDFLVSIVTFDCTFDVLQHLVLISYAVNIRSLFHVFIFRGLALYAIESPFQVFKLLCDHLPIHLQLSLITCCVVLDWSPFDRQWYVLCID